MAGRLAGKVAIITGSSRGLGQYCALAYGREGAIVAVAARTEMETDPRLPGTIYSTAEMVTAAGGEGFPVVCNVADQASVEAMAAAVIAKYGRIDILMNNAAVLPPGNISNVQLKHWELEFRINVNGAFFCTRAVLPAMIAQRAGNIINISSVAAERVSGHYGVSKYALEGMTLAFASEQRANNVAVNVLKPVGALDTPGIRFGGGAERAASLPPPDSYVEAAVLLAMQSAESCSGRIFNDAEAIAELGAHWDGADQELRP